MLGKTLSSLVTLLISFSVSQPAQSAVKLTALDVKHLTGTMAIDLSFDKAMSSKAIKPGFERNFVQYVLKSTKMDSSRMIPVNGSEIQKVFAYPYSIDTVRVRLILKKEGLQARNNVTVKNLNSKTVRIQFKDPAVVEENPATPAAPVSAVKKEPETPKVAGLSAEDGNLLKEVITNTPEIDIHNPDSVKAALNAAQTAQKTAAKEEQKTDNGPVGIKADPTKQFARMAIGLFAILGVFFAAVWAVRRYAVNLKKLPFGKKERLIQVVATHYMGNKKSISLVKVAGEYMVVGVSNDGIQLISKLGAEVSVDKYLEDRYWGGTFEKHLNSYARDPKVNKEIEFDKAGDSTGYDGPRDLSEPAPRAALEQPQVPADSLVGGVTDNVELSTVRKSIREKLTKLKPLQ